MLLLYDSEQLSNHLIYPFLFVLIVEVMARFMPSGTLDEREAKWKECLLSIGKRCQVLRSGRALKPELLNPSSSCSDPEGLALVPISNTSEENTAAESICTQDNVTLEVDKSLGVAQTPPQINLGLYSFAKHIRYLTMIKPIFA